MDTSTLFSVAPTFPIDDTRIRERSRETILRSPLTWVPFATAGVIGLVMEAGFAGFTILFGVAVAIVVKCWDTRRAELCRIDQDPAAARLVVAQHSLDRRPVRRGDHDARGLGHPARLPRCGRRHRS